MRAWGRKKKEPKAGALPLSFASEKKLLLGLLALVVAIPFPMAEPQPEGVVSWAGVFLYSVAVIFFLVRTRRGKEGSIPGWAMNLLAIAYLPWFVFRLKTMAALQLASPMVELLMFGLVVKLFSLRRERDKWHVSGLLFFLFVAAMATSIHPLIFVYLMAFFGFWLTLLFRFMHLHLVGTYREGAPGAGSFSPRPLLLSCAVLALFGAVPLFTMLPRFRTPYIQQGLPGRQEYTTGFRDEVSLDVVGNIRQSDEVALRMKPEDPTLAAPYLLRGTTYDRFQDLRWKRSRLDATPLEPATRNLYRLAPDETEGKVRIWLEPIDSNSLILPAETVSVELSRRLFVDAGGGVMMNWPRQGLLEYRVGVAARPVFRGAIPDLDSEDEATLDQGGVTPRIRELAVRLSAGFPPAVAAKRIERYLTDNFEYTLDFLGRQSENPIEDFLFQYRSGHCEYFASSMIFMLRATGVPARLATGFLGAEFNPLEDYYIVRQNNAHAWVEAYLPDVGWTTFDPTPPSGRPVVKARPTALMVLRQAWDYLEFRWDRYVMAYGFFDQVGLILRLRDFLRQFERREFSLPSMPRLPFEGGEGELAKPEVGLENLGGLWIAIAALCLGLAIALLIAIRRRRRFGATAAYRRLRDDLGRREPALSVATAPLALKEWVVQNLPQAAGPSAQLIDLYLLESFGERRLSAPQTVSLRTSLGEVRSVLRRTKSSTPGGAAPWTRLLSRFRSRSF